MSISGQTLLHATTVHAYEFYSSQGKPVDRGRLGLAILGSPFTQEYKLILYATKQQYIAQAPLVPSFQLTVQSGQYASFYDEHRKSWSVNFETQKGCDEFAKQLFVAKVNTNNKKDSIVMQDLVNGSEYAASLNDEVECKYTVWQFADSKIGKVLESDVSIRLQLGKGMVTKGLENGIVGMKETGRRLVCVPQSLAYGRQGRSNVIPSLATLVYEVELQKVLTVDKHGSAKSKTASMKARRQRQREDQGTISSASAGSSSPKESRHATGDTTGHPVASSSPPLQELMSAEELEAMLKETKQSPTASRKKRSLKSTSTNSSQAPEEAYDDQLEFPIAEEKKKPVMKPKPPKPIPLPVQRPEDGPADPIGSPVKQVQRSAPVPIKPKPVVPKKRPLSLPSNEDQPEAEKMCRSQDTVSPEPLPVKRDVASLKARLSQQTYMGRSPKQERRAESHPEPSVVTDMSPPSHTANGYRNSADMSRSKVVGLGPSAVLLPEVLPQRCNSASAKVAQLEKEISQLNQQLEEQEHRHQNQLSLIRERYEKLKQMLRDKEEEIESIKDHARRKVKEKQEEAQKEVERVAAQMQKQQSKLNRKVSDLKGELSEIDSGYVHIGTADLLRQGDIFLAEDELKYPEQVRRVGQGHWGDIRLVSFRGCPVYIELVNQVTLTTYTRDAFEIEVSQAVRLRHPNILQVLGVVLSANQPSLVTDLYESTVRDALTKRSFDKNEVIRYACDMSKALNFLHLSKPPIFHGNVTSSGVILQSGHQGFKAKLIHDGLAQFLGKTEPTALQKNKIYHPAGDAAMQSEAIDCYSLGVLVCEMSIRRLPMPEQRDKQISSISARSVRELVQYCIVGDARGHRATMGNVIEMLRKIIGK